MVQAKLNEEDGLTPINERNEEWDKQTPSQACLDYIAQAKEAATWEENFRVTEIT